MTENRRRTVSETGRATQHTQTPPTGIRGVSPHAEQARLRSTPARQAQTPSTAPHVRGGMLACGSIGGGGNRGVSPPYLAGSFASDGRGTLCLLAGREQAGAPAVVSPGITAGPSGGKKGRGQAQGDLWYKMRHFQHRETFCIPAQRANGRKRCDILRPARTVAQNSTD